MGWAYSGVCHETAAQFIESFASFYPHVTDQYVATISPPTLNESTGMLFTTYMLKGVVGATNYSKPLTLSVQPCTASTALTLTDVFGLPPLQDAANAWAAGFLTPMLVGLIAWGISRVLKFD